MNIIGMAAGAKVKSNVPTNGAAPKGKPAKIAPTPSPLASGTATPVGDVPRTGRPDKAAYDTEQESLKAKIAELQEKNVSAPFRSWDALPGV